jgi:hypothetical protein
MTSSNAFMFGKVALYKDAAGAIPADLFVGFEIDTDIDSRGEFLILASGINTTEWTTDGVQVWQDKNEDVGGKKPHSPDDQVSDGYETLLFDAGVGADPDLAWVRISPNEPSSIEFAFKTDLVPSSKIFAWWAWTSLGTFDPAKIELVDSAKDNTSWNLDNTCAWIFNAKPTNMLVNICPFSYPTAVPTITPTPSPLGCGPDEYKDPGTGRCNSCSVPPSIDCKILLNDPGALWFQCKCQIFN